jgi:D-ribose pyranase
MVKNGILHPQLKQVLASTGHKDYLGLVDSGFRVPQGIERVDLAFVPNIPTILQTLEGILAEFTVEKVILASGIHEYAPEYLVEIQKRLSDAMPIEFVSAIEFMEKMKQSKAIIRTGNFGVHCGNMILVAGCAY